MKVAALILMMFLAAVSAAGQVVSLKNDIPESQYLAAEAKAAGLLKTANYRSVWTKEYVDDRSNTAILEEKRLREVVQPNKSRTIDERFVGKGRRIENIFDGKALYFRRNDEPWSRGNSWTSVSRGVEGREVQRDYKSFDVVEFEGQSVQLYQMVSLREPGDPFNERLAGIPYVHSTRIWYSFDGRILRKIVGMGIEGSNDMFREVTTYEYDPKDLKIEAPAIK